MFHRNVAVRPADGTSTTIGIGERANRFVPGAGAEVLPADAVTCYLEKGLGCRDARTPSRGGFLASAAVLTGTLRARHRG
jgi:hypothetical protein